jgi:hypothetical protein
MVEMRWVERPSIFQYGNTDGSRTVYMDKVLQYRQQDTVVKDGWWRQDWSEWIDVPTVTDS